MGRAAAKPWWRGGSIAPSPPPSATKAAAASDAFGTGGDFPAPAPQDTILYCGGPILKMEGYAPRIVGATMLQRFITGGARNAIRLISQNSDTNMSKLGRMPNGSFFR